MKARVDAVRHIAITGTGGHGSAHGIKPSGVSAPANGETDGDKVFRTVYSATPAAGDENLQVDWTLLDGAPQCIGDQGSYDFQHSTRWNGLSHLTADANVKFVATSSNHGDVFYATPGANAKTLKTAKLYRRIAGIALPITAASLIYGGINDIYNDWRPPHKSHRTGNDLDFDGRSNSPAEHQLIKQLGERGGGFRLCEPHNGNHVHCYAGPVYR
ncbi:MAG: hypothetical protein H0W68_00395 [Gemmatimonadaceae bacterium]|nr:hypothetical protein [Gemmatimonadaceae bacterium]